jgi:hypothetical protein
MEYDVLTCFLQFSVHTWWRKRQPVCLVSADLKKPENNVPLNFRRPKSPSCICTHHRRSFHPATWPPPGRVGARQHGRLEGQLVPIGHTAIHFVLFIHNYRTEASEMSVAWTGQCGSHVSSPMLQKGMIYVQYISHFLSPTEP